MQTLALLMPEPFAGRVVEARARLSEDPQLGRVLDPPFAHFTLQMVDEYDWDALAPALTDFARKQAPIPIRTVGLLTVTGPSTGITLEPYRDERLARFHAELWDVVTPLARGTVAPFYLPDRWVPHVTIKRCGPHHAAFGRAMEVLSDETFIWNMQVDTLSVQHDPANNNQTRYQRLCAPLGETQHASVPTADCNATIVNVESPADSGTPGWTVSVQTDDGARAEVRWSAPDAVRIMAQAKAPLVYFAGARCKFVGDTVSHVAAVAPHPIM